MRILFINRPKDLWIGGDYVQMEKTAEELRKIGVEVDISEQPAIRPAILMRQYDIVHTFNFSMEWSKIACWVTNLWKKKFVASMIYHEGENFVSYNDQRKMITGTHKCIFINKGELERAKRHLDIEEEKISIIPNGIDDFWFKKVKVNSKDEFVFTPGRLDGTKGQLETAKACKDLGIKYICAGEVIDKDYANKVEKLGAILSGPLDKEQMLKMYASCSVMALASKAEIMSLVVMEAMAQKKPIVLSTTSEWKPKKVFYCEHGNSESIADAINKASKLKSIDYNVEKYKWSNVAKKIKLIYENLLNE